MNVLVSTAVVCLIVSAVHVTANLGGSSFLGYIKVYSPGTGFPTLNERLKTFAEAYDTIPEAQVGFRSRYKYMGCYLDDAKRMIAAIWVDRSDMTHGWCFNNCRKGHHKYAALQYYTHCFCGDSINIVRYPKKPESDCNQPCRGNTSEMCGGTWRNSLYRLF